MHQLLAELFGFSFVHMENSCASLIRRVRYNPDGRAYVVYFGGKIVWLDDCGGWKVSPFAFRMTANA